MIDIVYYLCIIKSMNEIEYIYGKSIRERGIWIMNKKYKIAMTVGLATTSIAYSIGGLFAQSEDTIKEETPVQATEEDVETEGLETVVEESLENSESIQNIEKAVGDIAIDVTNFPDSTFRNYISTNFDTNNDGVLSSDEIANIISIDVDSNRNITSVVGIEHFPNLTYLNCRNTGITSIDVSKNVMLEKLNVRDSNYFTSLDVSNNPNLTHLSCGNSGGFTGLDVSNNPNLTYLNCSNSYMKSLDLSKNLKLEILIAELTLIENLDVSKNTELRGLSIFDSDRIVGTVDISNCTKLAWMRAADNTFVRYNIKKSSSVINLDGMESTFNIRELYNRIDTSKIRSINGASLNGGIVSGYTFGTPITYEYYCDYDTNGQVYLDVTINVRGKSSIVIDDSLDKVYDGTAVADPINITKTGSNGAITFEWYKADGTKLQAAPTEAGDYKVKAILAEDNQYISAEVEKEFTIEKAGSTITINDDLNKVYDGTTVVEPTVNKTGSTGTVTFEWYTANDTKLQTAPINVGSYKVKAILADDANHIGAEVEKEFTIGKATSTITINDDLNKIYDGTAVIEPSVTTTGSTGAVTFEWYTTDDTPLQTAPVEAGSYKVKAILADDTNYTGAEVEKEFTIGKVASTIIINDDLNKIYDGIAVVEPTDIVTTGSTGTVSIEWYAADGALLTSAPVNAGSYKVKVILAEDTSYAGVEVEKEFTIFQAVSSVTITVELDKTYDGEAVVEPQVSVIGSTGDITYEWYKKEESTTRAVTWMQLPEAPKEVGSYKVVVTVAGDENFEGVTVEKEFSISEQVTVAPGQSVTGVQTGDSTQAGLWTILVGLSTGMMMYFRRKNRKEEA